MVPQITLLVTFRFAQGRLLVTLFDRIPLPDAPARRGRPKVYPDHLFLKALVLMIVRRL